MPSFVNRCLSLTMHRLMHFFLVLYCLLSILPPSSKRNFQEASKMQNINFCNFSITLQFLSPQTLHPFLSNFVSLSLIYTYSYSINLILVKKLYEFMNFGPNNFYNFNISLNPLVSTPNYGVSIVPMTPRELLKPFFVIKYLKTAKVSNSGKTLLIAT